MSVPGPVASPAMLDFRDLNDGSDGCRKRCVKIAWDIVRTTNGPVPAGRWGGFQTIDFKLPSLKAVVGKLGRIDKVGAQISQPQVQSFILSNELMQMKRDV